MDGWKSVPVALHPRLAIFTLLGLIQPTAYCGSLVAMTTLVPFSVLFSTRTILIGKTSVKFGSAKQLVSSHEATIKMIYTITTWRCSSLFLVDDWDWNVEMLWRAGIPLGFPAVKMQFSCVDHPYLPCALCCGSAIDTYALPRHVTTCSRRRYLYQFLCFLSFLNCSVPMSANVSKTVKHSV